MGWVWYTNVFLCFLISTNEKCKTVELVHVMVCYKKWCIAENIIDLKTCILMHLTFLNQLQQINLFLFGQEKFYTICFQRNVWFMSDQIQSTGLILCWLRFLKVNCNSVCFPFQLLRWSQQNIIQSQYWEYYSFTVKDLSDYGSNLNILPWSMLPIGS